MELYISALILGIMGSFHCAGMCGPIALALPLRGKNSLERVSGGLLYNIGRTLMYGVMGGFFGLIGEGFSMIGFQKWVSIVMGLLMILSVLTPLLFRKVGNLINNPFTGRLRDAIGRLFVTRSYKGLFTIGVLNALLPCGLVYMAIAGAIGTASTGSGIVFMILFGLGTIPMMLAISLIGNIITLPVRKRINRIIPYMIVVIGLIFVLRGLSLGIPYLSPPAEKMTPEIHMKSSGMKHK